MTNKSILINEWEPYFKKPNTKDKSNFLRVVICGPSNSGKSYLLNKLAVKIRNHYDLIAIYCSSEDTREEYRKSFKTEVVKNSFEPEDIDKIKQRNTELEASGENPLKVLCVYDDYACRTNKNDDTIFNMAISGRHACISWIMVIHDMVLIDRVMRDQLSHLFLTRQTAYTIYESIVDYYLLLPAMQNCDDKSKIRNNLMKLMQKATANYGVILIDLENYKKDPNGTLRTLLYRYKA